MYHAAALRRRAFRLPTARLLKASKYRMSSTQTVFNAITDACALESRLNTLLAIFRREKRLRPMSELHICGYLQTYTSTA
ncbi:hypothetical protein NM688_g434 [Phlebia brevispora]|uniref:Uncharacterized protein n=1 Tax=Phlebia brevispora TaxID=194682 RepID=A0ACC1TE71_9APHY|nr:hypothetical protein NM688_g434 [Phlebia brevispora]